MKGDLRSDFLFPALASLPGTLPWRLAGVVGRESGLERAQRIDMLQAQFAQIFPDVSKNICLEWAQSHLEMLAQEMVDAMAFDRLGFTGGPEIELQGLEFAKKIHANKMGCILVLNHFDRLLTAPVALARHGIFTNVLTMPVLNNPDLAGPQRRFLLKKIKNYTQATKGCWRTTDEGLRPVLESLSSGGIWVILADAWRPEFGRLRPHDFLGGRLNLPTGIERLAKSAAVPLLHARTYSDSPARMRVVLEALPEDPVQAIDGVVAQLDQDVRARPWAWWHWGLWDQMWSPNS